jgi:transcriptional regulator with XRE-family HTH domain
MPVGNRVREIRRARNLTLQTLAEKLETTPTHVRRLEASEQRLSDKWTEKLCSAFQCTPEDLYRETTISAKPLGTSVQNRVPIFGSLRAGEVRRLKDSTLYHATLPGYDEDLCAVAVEEDSLWPAYQQGDFVFARAPQDGVHPNCIGHDCIVKTVDGPILIRKVLFGTKSDLRLSSYHAPEIDNVRLEWATKILWIQKP